MFLLVFGATMIHALYAESNAYYFIREIKIEHILLIVGKRRLYYCAIDILLFLLLVLKRSIFCTLFNSYYFFDESIIMRQIDVADLYDVRDKKKMKIKFQEQF